MILQSGHGDLVSAGTDAQSWEERRRLVFEKIGHSVSFDRTYLATAISESVDEVIVVFRTGYFAIQPM